MDKLKIIRPNGEEEIAELTTDKSLVGNNYLKLDIGGVPHYAKVGDVVDTHMYTFSGVDGKKYYIKKEIGNVENPPSGDSPTLNIFGTLTLMRGMGNMMIATREKINTTSDGYQVFRVEITNLLGNAAAKLMIDGISDFYNKPGIYATTIIKVKIGDVAFDTNRDDTNIISGGLSNADFMKLKKNIGKPLNFSIKYE